MQEIKKYLSSIRLVWQSSKLFLNPGLVVKAGNQRWKIRQQTLILVGAVVLVLFLI